MGTRAGDGYRNRLAFAPTPPTPQWPAYDAAPLGPEEAL